MFMRSLKSWLVVIVGLTVLTAHARAGDISGVVKYKKSGSPASGVKISGLTAGALGGSSSVKPARTSEKNCTVRTSGYPHTRNSSKAAVRGLASIHSRTRSKKGLGVSDERTGCTGAAS